MKKFFVLSLVLLSSTAMAESIKCVGTDIITNANISLTPSGSVNLPGKDGQHKDFPVLSASKDNYEYRATLWDDSIAILRILDKKSGIASSANEQVPDLGNEKKATGLMLDSASYGTMLICTKVAN